MNLAFIGAGKMAEAIIAAIIRAELPISPFYIKVSDIDPARLAALAKQYRTETAGSNREAVQWADTVFLCVKPQHLEEVLREIADVATPEHLFISIAAGKKLADIEHRLSGARVIRVMPNVCCLAGEGMNVFTLGSRASEEDRENALTLLGAAGVAHELPEDKFDAVTALSGSGPAFFARFLIHLIDAAKAEGLSEDDASVLATQTMFGTAVLLRASDLTPEQLIRHVASAKGTTAEGLAVLDGSDFGKIIGDTIAAAARRSRELGRAVS
jgi:pyrroline-5-carboxylate reductase